MQTIKIHGAAALRVPAISPFTWGDSARMWCCCEDLEDSAADTGTLWIDYHLLDSRACGPSAGAGGLDFARGLSALIASDPPWAGREIAAAQSTPTPDGSICRVSYQAEDKGELLVFHRWDRAVAIGYAVMLVHFSLVFTEPTAERPAWKRLAETLDREVRAAAISLPREGPRGS